MATPGRERTDSADLNGDAGEIGEPAQRITSERDGPRIDRTRMRLHEIRQIEIADKLVEHDAFTEDLANEWAIVPGHPHEPGGGRVHPTEHLLDRDRRRDPHCVLRPHDQAI